MSAETAVVDTGCACTPAWPELVVHRDDGTTVTVLPADTPGPMAALYYARCATCGITYPGPFRLPPRTHTTCRAALTTRGQSQEKRWTHRAPHVP